MLRILASDRKCFLVAFRGHLRRCYATQQKLSLSEILSKEAKARRSSASSSSGASVRVKVLKPQKNEEDMSWVDNLLEDFDEQSKAEPIITSSSSSTPVHIPLGTANDNRKPKESLAGKDVQKVAATYTKERVISSSAPRVNESIPSAGNKDATPAELRKKEDIPYTSKELRSHATTPTPEEPVKLKPTSTVETSQATPRTPHDFVPMGPVKLETTSSVDATARPLTTNPRESATSKSTPSVEASQAKRKPLERTPRVPAKSKPIAPPSKVVVGESTALKTQNEEPELANEDDREETMKQKSQSRAVAPDLPKGLLQRNAFVVGLPESRKMPVSLPAKQRSILGSDFPGNTRGSSSHVRSYVLPSRSFVNWVADAQSGNNDQVFVSASDVGAASLINKRTPPPLSSSLSAPNLTPAAARLWMSPQVLFSSLNEVVPTFFQPIELVHKKAKTSGLPFPRVGALVTALKKCRSFVDWKEVKTDTLVRLSPTVASGPGYGLADGYYVDYLNQTEGQLILKLLSVVPTFFVDYVCVQIALLTDSEEMSNSEAWDDDEENVARETPKRTKFYPPRILRDQFSDIVEMGIRNGMDMVRLRTKFEHPLRGAANKMFTRLAESDLEGVTHMFMLYVPTYYVSFQSIQEKIPKHVAKSILEKSRAPSLLFALRRFSAIVDFHGTIDSPNLNSLPIFVRVNSKFEHASKGSADSLYDQKQQQTLFASANRRTTGTHGMNIDMEKLTGEPGVLPRDQSESSRGRVDFPEATKIILVDRQEKMEEAVSLLQRTLDEKKIRVLGVDMEWVGARKAALLQICDGSNVFLFRLHQYSMESGEVFLKIPRSLAHILEDGSVLKSGVGILNDKKRLERDYGVRMQGTVDLSHLTLYAGFPSHASGLAAITKRVLGIRLGKDKAITVSNWEKEHLSQEQITYAANDARASYFVFAELHKHCRAHLSLGAKAAVLEDLPPEARIEIELESELEQFCGPILDARYRANSMMPKSLETSRRAPTQLRQLVDRNLTLRIAFMYMKYAPDKLSTIPSLLRAHRSPQERKDLLQQMVDKYGPEPGARSASVDAEADPDVDDDGTEEDDVEDEE